jgi:hypothetical protein
MQATLNIRQILRRSPVKEQRGKNFLNGLEMSVLQSKLLAQLGLLLQLNLLLQTVPTETVLKKQQKEEDGESACVERLTLVISAVRQMAAGMVHKLLRRLRERKYPRRIVAPR